MIRTFQLLRNLGQFDSVDAGRNLPLNRLTLIYAENGRGKTTLAAVLRSLGGNDPAPILERHRLGAQHPPQVVLAGAGNATAMFQNGAWQNGIGDALVFDDTFVTENVCSGMKVESEHRGNLHELIIGAQGAALNAALQEEVGRIEGHNREIARKSGAIPATLRGDMTVDVFCALNVHENIDEAIHNAEQNLAAGRESDAIQQQRGFAAIPLPDFDLAPIDALLSRQLTDLETAAANQVRAHLSNVGKDGEAWVASGMNRIKGSACPFCAQDLKGSPLIAHYQAYFSAAYRDLNAQIGQSIRQLGLAHTGDMVGAFERSVAQAATTQQFWARFTRIDAVTVDTAALALARQTAFDAVSSVLQAKQAAPLERMSLGEKALAAVAAYRAQRQLVLELNARLEAANKEVALVKERAATANVSALERDLRILVTSRDRFKPEVDALCQDYVAEKAAKTATEERREAARAALDAHRNTVFPGYEQAINRYLQRFGAGFRLSGVSSVNTRGGASCNYTVLINAHEVPLSTTDEGVPSFKNTMSAGDRNTLALAFFFAKLEQEPNLANKIVVIDDPMTSLDDHRSLTTVQEINRLCSLTGQLLVLSHSKRFLFDVWDGAERDVRAAIKIARAGQASSTLTAWDVSRDCISEHDRRHELVSRYIENSVGINERDVAAALRHILEAFVRVAYPQHFPAGDVLGGFLNRCVQREGTPQQILDPQDRTELRELLDYANQFHHDNPTWQTVVINDQELTDFSRRTLAFIAK